MKWLLAIVGAMVLLGGAIKRFGKPDILRAPQTLTCRALGEHGPGDNPRVRLTDYSYLRSYVETTVRSGGSTSLVKFYPVVPTGEERREASGTNVHVVLKSREILYFAGSGTAIEGIVESASALSGSAGEKLRAAYPQIDFKSVWVLEVAEGGLAEQDAYRRSIDAEFSVMALVGGLAMTVAGVAWIVLARRARSRRSVAPD